MSTPAAPAPAAEAAKEKVPMDKNQCRRVLEKNPQDRTFQEILIILDLLEGVRAFQNIPRDQKAELCRQIKYQKFAPGATVFNQGDVGSTFYIVFSGYLDVLVTNEKGMTNNVSHLSEGATFGEVALTQTSTRTATIVAKNDTELLAIEKRDYDAILKSPLAHELKEKLAFLRRVAVFQRALSAMELHSLTYVMTTRSYPRNAVIVREGEEADAIFFVKSGELSVIKRLALSPDRVGPAAALLTREFPDPWELPRPGETGYVELPARRRTLLDTPLAPPRTLASRRAEASSASGGGTGGRRFVTARQRIEALMKESDRDRFAGKALPSGGLDGAGPLLPPLPLANLGPSGAGARRAVEPMSARLESGTGHEPLPAGAQTDRPHASSEALAWQEGALHKKRQLGSLPPSAPREVRFVEIGVLAAYDYFGEVGLLLKTRRTATVVARTNVEVFCMTKWDFLRRASKQILNAMRADISKYPSDEMLRAAFYGDQQWQSFKRDLLTQIHVEKKAAGRDLAV